MGAMAVVGLCGVVLGLVLWQPVLFVGVVLLLVAPLGFLRAAPPPTEHTRDYVADAYMRIFPRNLPPK